MQKLSLRARTPLMWVSKLSYVNFITSRCQKLNLITFYTVTNSIKRLIDIVLIRGVSCTILLYNIDTIGSLILHPTTPPLVYIRSFASLYCFCIERAVSIHLILDNIIAITYFRTPLGVKPVGNTTVVPACFSNRIQIIWCLHGDNRTR